MKIIHTSDWHLGQNLYNYDRTEEHSDALRQIEELVRQETPDALVVSGDIYDTPQPSSAVQTLFTEAVMRMHEASPRTEIIITAGNHDSGAKHEISRVLWKTQKVHMIGTINKEDTLEQIIRIPGKGFIIAVPYSSERHIPEGFWQGLLDEVEAQNDEGLPVVLSAHLTVSGCDFQGHDSARDVSVGGIDAVDLEVLGTGYDYVALGHIHRAQTIEGSDGRVRYSGTPIPVSFDENYPHTVSVVEIASHGATPAIREIAIDNPYPLVTLPSDGYAPWDEVKRLLTEYPKDNPSYVRLNVEVEDVLPPDAIPEARKILSEGEGRFCLVNARRKRVESAEKTALSVTEFRAMEPIAVARLYAEESGRVFDEELEALFNEVVSEVKEDERKA
jgi:exonuclease SbcD